MNEEELIKENCKRCINYEICQATGCVIKKEIEKLKHQQKEFIEFLEQMWKETQDIWYIKILHKYKEIIGEKDE